MFNYFKQFMADIPSELLSFMAGAVFSVGVNLATEKWETSGEQRGVIIILLLVSTLGFILTSSIMKRVEEGATKDNDPSQEKISLISEESAGLILGLVLAMLPIFSLIYYQVYYIK